MLSRFSCVWLFVTLWTVCSLPGSSVFRILQARIQEWVVISSPGYLPDPGIEPMFLTSPALAGGFFATSTIWEVLWSFWKWKSLSCVQLLCDPIDCSLPGFSVCGIFQARILESVTFPFSSGSSQSRDWSQISCTAGRFVTSWATRKA